MKTTCFNCRYCAGIDFLEYNVKDDVHCVGNKTAKVRCGYLGYAVENNAADRQAAEACPWEVKINE